MNHDGQDVGAIKVDGAGLLETGCQLVKERLPSGTSLSVVRQLGGGYTDAQVVLCDISSDPGTRLESPSGLSGQFILKVQLTAGGSQAAAHAAFRQALPDFAASHVPELVLSASGVGVTADVYDIAGYSLDGLRTAEHVTDYADREESCVLVARDLLTAQLVTAGQPDYTPTGASVLRDWLGNRLP